ncbi:BZ3500_MvSof-1268-A1-R1_Chr2-2g04970 [Microbotryum saponariae]|uniref:DNA topoisomerase 2 n=1 Tax=Microbotryum saponariae TaxID=289078 RepID=A0A2X0L205_9BASI|nr:BZ3500_MvSof-1268-A1-R1_Chr2-2g04970 [Microbotryum saponariae]SDA00594.1 BZ3501_MvSof-1269-A2-R1_Chr2-2g04644 [Microbotryum saponariae]
MVDDGSDFSDAYVAGGASKTKKVGSLGLDWGFVYPSPASGASGLGSCFVSLDSLDDSNTTPDWTGAYHGSIMSFRLIPPLPFLLRTCLIPQHPTRRLPLHSPFHQTAAPKAAPKPKAAAKPKTATAGAAAASKKKKVLQEHDTNGASSADEAYGMEDDDHVPEMRIPSATKKTKAKSASETYVKLSQLEHVLKRPDTYIGSIEAVTQQMWVFDPDTTGGTGGTLVNRQTTFVPGLYKIFDEILVNAADNKAKNAEMSYIKVTINREDKKIVVENDGPGIPIEEHKTEKVWIPEMIFGTLLTSSNYDDEEEKVTGGRNGYGAKLANIYSTEFVVETATSNDMKTYKQTFKNNMGTKGKPIVKDITKAQDYTRVSMIGCRITFYPDLARFGMTEFDDDTVALLTKRVYDMAGIIKGVNVYLNGKKLSLKNFKQYVEMYTAAIEAASKPSTKKSGENEDMVENLDLVGVDPLAAGKKNSVIYGQFGQWEIAFALSDGQFTQVSYCNSIATTKGGTHVNYIADQIVSGLVDLIKKKNKAAPVKAFQIKNHLSVFINCKIPNPSFDSQTKENMTLSVSKFGAKFKCVLDDDFLKKVARSGVIDNVLNWAKFKQDQMLKKTDGHKRSRITGLVKLEDANNAGTRNGSKCTLILTEGDSAKALAVSGLAVVGRDNYGVFPLRGKLLNVREAAGKALLDNVEIQAIKQILGLQQGKVYTDVDSLRYGKLMIMADQDHDGSHIKGLIINFLDYWFPSLLKLKGFLLEFITPIVKATKGNKELSFFTIPQYEQWKEETDDGRGWRIKYFKGLGTSDARDAVKYFGNMDKHRLPFRPSTQEERELIDMAFNKKKADNRKEWLRGFVPGTYLDHSIAEVPIEDFINKELILFSMADNVRSIPSVIDGFKPGQRKVLFGCFKRKLTQEIKVGQLGGYVAEHSAYHHGEMSLQGTIIGLAQQFVGSNNLNILDPNGQFGTRLQGGKDAASARYIFTNVSSITRSVFHPADDSVLEYLNDDGQSIEPSWYIPIIPMALVNGSEGIGTGWSSSVPNYNPTDIVANLRRKMRGEEMEPMHPWYRGFKGTIEKTEKDGYVSTGHIERLDDATVEITELPIRTWTQTYKEMLESWVVGTEKSPALIKDYKEYHTDTTVHFIITLTEKGKDAISKEGLEKCFKMQNKISISNMVMFDSQGKIKKYATPEEVLDDFYDVRLEYYHKRKAFLVDELTNIHDKLSNQARFISMMISKPKQLTLDNRSTADIVQELRAKGFRPFPKVQKAAVAGVEADAEEDADADAGMDSDYDYLLSMALRSLTREKIQRLEAECKTKHDDLNTLLALSPKDLWSNDLETFAAQWEQLLERDSVAHQKASRAAKAKGKGTKKGKKAAAYSEDEEDVYGDEEDFVYKPKPTKRAPVVKKPKALPSDDGKDDFVVEAKEVIVKKSATPALVAMDVDDLAAKPKPAAAVSKTGAKKRVVDASSEADDTPKKKAKPAPKPKKQAALSDDDDDNDASFAKPVKAPVAKKAAARHDDSDDDDDTPIIKKKAVVAKMKPKASPKAAAKPKPKAAVKSKQLTLSDDDSDAGSSIHIESAAKVAPKARAARAASTKAKAKAAYMELSDEDDGGDGDDASDFNGSD